MKIRLGGHSERGKTHIINKKPNQDSLVKLQFCELSIISVADGHGGEKHSMSEFGSMFANLAVINTFVKFIKSTIDDNALEEIKKDIILQWSILVNNDINKSCSSDAQKFNNIISYGTTLLFAVALNNICLIGQIGDGNIVIVDNNDIVTDAFAQKPQNLANQTTSLCDENAISNFDLKLINSENIKSILISTDGVINSFIDEKDFYELPKIINKEFNIQDFNYNLEQMLNRITNFGSGDDCTIGYMKFEKNTNKSVEGKIINIKEEICNGND